MEGDLRSWPLSGTCASAGGARTGAGLGSGPGRLRPAPQRSARSRGRGKPRAGGPFAPALSHADGPSPRDAPASGGGAAASVASAPGPRLGTRPPGCRQGPAKARARPFAKARRGRAGGRRLRRLLVPGRAGGGRDRPAAGPAGAWGVAGSGAHGVRRPPAPSEARFPLSRLSGVSARSRGESEFTPKLADGAGGREGRLAGRWPWAP